MLELVGWIDKDVALQVPALALFATVVAWLVRSGSKEREKKETADAIEREADRNERKETREYIGTLANECHRHSTEREDRLLKGLEQTAVVLQQATTAIYVASAGFAACRHFEPDTRKGWMNTSDDTQVVNINGSELRVPPGFGVIEDEHGPRVATPSQFQAYRLDQAARQRRQA